MEHPRYHTGGMAKFYPGETVVPTYRYRELIEGHQDAVFMYGEPYVPQPKPRTITIQIKGADAVSQAFRDFEAMLLDQVARDLGVPFGRAAPRC